MDKPKRPRRVKTTLTLMQELFVAEYVKTGNAKHSAIKAGYSEASANQTAHDLLHQHKGVMAAIEKVRAKYQANADFGIEKAMSEAYDAAEFARKTGNANALVKAIELRSKLQGLLVEKHEVKQVGFQIQIRGVNEIPKEIPSPPNINILPEPKKDDDDSSE